MSRRNHLYSGAGKERNSCASYHAGLFRARLICADRSRCVKRCGGLNNKLRNFLRLCQHCDVARRKRQRLRIHSLRGNLLLLGRDCPIVRCNDKPTRLGVPCCSCNGRSQNRPLRGTLSCEQYFLFLWREILSKVFRDTFRSQQQEAAIDRLDLGEGRSRPV